MSFGYF